MNSNQYKITIEATQTFSPGNVELLIYLLKKIDSETVDKIHKLDVRLNIVETKALLIAAVCSFAIGGIIQLIVKILGK